MKLGYFGSHWPRKVWQKKERLVKGVKILAKITILFFVNAKGESECPPVFVKPSLLQGHRQGRVACVVLFPKDILDGWGDFE